MYLAVLGNYARPLLLRFNSSPGEHFYASTWLVHHLRCHCGANRQSCIWPYWEIMLDPFCCASTTALVSTSTPRAAWWITCGAIVVQTANHVSGRTGKLCTTPVVRVQQQPWVALLRRTRHGVTPAVPLWCKPPIMYLAVLGNYARPLLLRFNNSPGEHFYAARCLVDQLRCHCGANRQSCIWPYWEIMLDPFCCASTTVLVSPSTSRFPWSTLFRSIVVQTANHVSGRTGKLCSTPFVALQQQPW